MNKRGTFPASIRTGGWPLASLGVVLLAILLLTLATPAQACGCGIYRPREGDGYVSQERALVRWDGRQEDIVMALSVQGQSPEAAWILPVPSQASVQLASPQLFDTLQELTKPRVERKQVPRGDGAAGGAAPGAGGVSVLERQNLGPFEVSTLAANDASALSDWLAQNQYEFPPELAGVLKPYVEQNWLYVAVKLAPESGGQALKGNLQPIWVTFESTEPVYPMRASALATRSLPVFLYVLADHRMDKSVSFSPGSSRVSYADWVDPAALPADSPLRPFVGSRLFLTKFEDVIFNPKAINDDFTFRAAAKDDSFRDVVYQYDYVDSGPVGVPPGPLPLIAVLLGLPLLLLGLVIGFLVWRGRRIRARKAAAAAKS